MPFSAFDHNVSCVVVRGQFISYLERGLNFLRSITGRGMYVHLPRKKRSYRNLASLSRAQYIHAVVVNFAGDLGSEAVRKAEMNRTRSSSARHSYSCYLHQCFKHTSSLPLTFEGLGATAIFNLGVIKCKDHDSRLFSLEISIIA